MIQTGGGRYDPNDRHVFFLAGGWQIRVEEGETHGAQPHEHYLFAINEVMTSGTSYEIVERYIASGKRMLLDSGIFWLTNKHARTHGVHMDDALRLRPDMVDDFDKLFARYLEVIREHEADLWGYVELDLGGADVKRETRARLHDLGLFPIPVYHPLIDGWDYFDELAEQYDRICVGNIVQAPAAIRKRIIATVMERRDAQYPHLWMHMLGLTPNAWLNAYPVDSCDSSAWLSTVRWSPIKPSSMLRRYSTLPRDTMYDLGTMYGPTGWSKAVKSGAAEAVFMQQCWRAHQERVGAAGGLAVA